MERSNTYPDKFDLDNFSLSSFFSEIAVYLDLQSTGKTEKLTRKDYSAIAHASKILRDKSREIRMQEGNSNEIVFFWEFYGKKKDESNVEVSKKLSADRLIILSEELATAKGLFSKGLEELAKTCSNLSQKTREYWNLINPTGFKRYQH